MKLILFVVLFCALCNYCYAAAGADRSQRILYPYIFSENEATQWNARCLDGSPAGFFFINNTIAETQNKWTIYLQGGGYCLANVTGYLNVESCFTRAATKPMGSSKFWAANQSALAPMLLDSWNQVYIPYCSGDLWSGTRTEPLSGLYYQGHNIIKAVIEKLINDYSMGGVTEFIFHGVSAGGIGVINNADYVKTLLPPGVTYKVVSDAGWFLNVTVFNPNFISLQQAAQIITRNADGFVDQDCAAKYGDRKWVCLSGDFAFPYISSPIFFAESIFDTSQLYTQSGASQSPTNVASNSYIISYFGVEMRNSIVQVYNNPTAGLFLTSSLTHGVLFTNTISGGPYRGLSYNTTLNNWIQGVGPYKVWDTCYTPECAVFPYQNITTDNDLLCGFSVSQTQTGSWSSGSEQFTQWQATIKTGAVPLYAAELKVRTEGATSFNVWNLDQKSANIYTIPAWQYQNGVIPAGSSYVTFGYIVNSIAAATFKLNNPACFVNKPCSLSVSQQVTSTWTSDSNTYQSVAVSITNQATTAAANVVLQFNFYGGAYLSSSWNIAPSTHSAAETSKNFTCNLYNLAPGQTSTSCGFISQVETSRVQNPNVEVSLAQAVCL